MKKIVSLAKRLRPDCVPSTVDWPEYEVVPFDALMFIKRADKIEAVLKDQYEDVTR